MIEVTLGDFCDILLFDKGKYLCENCQVPFKELGVES